MTSSATCNNLDGCSVRFPSQIHFLMIDKCNARCVMCGGDYFRSKSGRRITFEAFKKMAANLRLENVASICLAGAGDPLLSPDLPDIVTYVNERYPTVAVSITTNGIALSPELSDQLIAHEISFINISINAATRSTYKQIMQVDQFERVVGNAAHIADLKRKTGNPLLLQFSIALNELNICELPKLIALAGSLGFDSVNAMYCRYYPKELRLKNISDGSLLLGDDTSLFYHQELSDFMVAKAVNLAQQLNIGFTHEPLFAENAPLRSCSWTESELMVGFDGEVYPCGGAELQFKQKVENGTYHFGNALTESIDQFWNNETYCKLRISSRQGESCPIPECRCCANLKSPNDRGLHFMEWERYDQATSEPDHPKIASGRPLVSVIVPTHNRPDMLGEAIQSILDQTLQDFEIIVVNDAGQDVSALVAAFNSPKISYIAHETNKGLAASRNTGIRAARGKYIAYLDDDDIFYPDHLQTLAGFLEESGEQVAYSDAYRAHQFLKDGAYKISERDVPYSMDFDYDLILKQNFTPVLCVMHVKSCLDAAGFFDETLKSHEDWDLWMRMSRYYSFTHIPRITCEFRWRVDMTSMTSRYDEGMEATQKIVAARGKALGIFGDDVYTDNNSIRWLGPEAKLNISAYLLSSPLEVSFTLISPELEKLPEAQLTTKITLNDAVISTIAFLSSSEEKPVKVKIDPSSQDAGIGIVSSAYFIPAQDSDSPDTRKLSVLMTKFNLTAVEGAASGHLRKAPKMAPVRQADIRDTFPTVSILVLCYNKQEYTKACVEQLLRVTPPHLYELIIVDNASSDGTAAYLHSLAAPNIKVIVNKENLGFVGGNNQAAAHARGKYIVFLNNDTKPQEGWLEALTRLPENDPAVGVVGAKLVYPDGRLQEAGGIIFNDASGCNYGKFQSPHLPEFNYVREADYCSGACLLVRTELFRNVGMFDERYAPAYFEDADLCFAARREGFEVLYTHEAVVEHFEGGTAGTDVNTGAKRYQEINKPKFIQKWSRELSRQPAVPGNLIDLYRSANHRRGKNVLVAHEMPQLHDRAAGALRIHDMMRMMREHGHHVTYVCRNGTEYEGVDLAPYIAGMRRSGIEVYSLDSYQNGTQQYARVLVMRDFDAAFLPFYYCAEFFIPLLREMSPKTRIVIDSVDIHYLRSARQLLQEGDLASWSGFNANMMREQNAYKLADAIMTVTEQDKEELERHFPYPPAIAVHSPHNSEPVTPGFGERSGIIFVAGFKHSPNVDATLYFHSEIWPLVKKRIPGIRWYIVGDSPPPHIQKMADDTVVVTGYVPEVEPYLKQARVSIAPIRFGAGMKGKIGCALAQGIPSVSTTIGAEGMGLTDGRDILVADMPDKFADAIVSLYTDESLWNSVMEAGKKLLDSRFGDHVVYPQFARALHLDKDAAQLQSAPEDHVKIADRISRACKLLMVGAVDVAEACFLECINTIPDSNAALAGLALAQALLNKLPDAFSTIKRVLDSTKTPAVHLTYLALIYDISGAPDKALQTFLAALGRDAEQTWVVNEAADFLKKVLSLGNAAEILSHGSGGAIDVTYPFLKQADAFAKAHDIKGCYDSLSLAMDIAQKTGNIDAQHSIKTSIDKLKQHKRR